MIYLLWGVPSGIMILILGIIRSWLIISSLNINKLKLSCGLTWILTKLILEFLIKTNIAFIYTYWWFCMLKLLIVLVQYRATQMYLWVYVSFFPQLTTCMAMCAIDFFIVIQQQHADNMSFLKWPDDVSPLCG